MNNLIAQLYNPDFKDFVEIDGLRFCRFDSGIDPQAELCYFKGVPLSQLSSLHPEGQYWSSKIFNLLDPDKRPMYTSINVPFVARMGSAYPAYDDYAVYIGWIHPSFIKIDLFAEASVRQQHLPHKIAQNGDKIGQELAERLFPHLVKEGRIYRA